MNGKATALKKVRESDRTSQASYFGVLVEVIDQMENCSLIRYRERERVVDTRDLQQWPEPRDAA